MTSLVLPIPRSFDGKKSLMKSLGTLVKTVLARTRSESRKKELAESFAKGASNEVLAELSRPFLKQKISCELCAKLPELDALVQKLKPSQRVLDKFLNTPVIDLKLSARINLDLEKETSHFVRDVLYKKTGEGSSFDNLSRLAQGDSIPNLIKALLYTLEKLHLESLTN